MVPQKLTAPIKKVKQKKSKNQSYRLFHEEILPFLLRRPKNEFEYQTFSLRIRERLLTVENHLQTLFIEREALLAALWGIDTDSVRQSFPTSNYSLNVLEDSAIIQPEPTNAENSFHTNFKLQIPTSDFETHSIWDYSSGRYQSYNLEKETHLNLYTPHLNEHDKPKISNNYITLDSLERPTNIQDQCEKALSTWDMKPLVGSLIKSTNIENFLTNKIDFKINNNNFDLNKNLNQDEFSIGKDEQKIPIITTYQKSKIMSPVTNGPKGVNLSNDIYQFQSNPNGYIRNTELDNPTSQNDLEMSQLHTLKLVNKDKHPLNHHTTSENPLQPIFSRNKLLEKDLVYEFPFCEAKLNSLPTEILREWVSHFGMKHSFNQVPRDRLISELSQISNYFTRFAKQYDRKSLLKTHTQIDKMDPSQNLNDSKIYSQIHKSIINNDNLYESILLNKHLNLFEAHFFLIHGAHINLSIKALKCYLRSSSIKFSQKKLI